MRDIKCRGKDERGNWHYGYYVDGYMFDSMTGQAYTVPFIVQAQLERKERVVAQTVGQYINQKDSEGNEICEGDVVSWYNPLIETGSRMIGVVVYDTKQATYKKCPNSLYKSNAGNGGYTGFEFRWHENVKVLGNIYDNPELLEI